MRGLSTPDYGRTVRQFAETSRRRLRELMKRRLDERDPACSQEPLPKLIADFLTRLLTLG